MPDNIENRKVVVVGVGKIAQEYAKILTDKNCSFTVIGRGVENVGKFTRETGIPAQAGGIDSFISGNNADCDSAIVAVAIDSLAAVTKSLLNSGIKNILVEKPGGNSLHEVSTIAELGKQTNANVLLAYNRRFYSSVLFAKNIIKEDGGVTSFNFEFTEWEHEIEKLPHSIEIKQNWLMANSSHVIDLAFHLGGFPSKMSSYSKDELSWHRPVNFSGAGISETNALFSYYANWNAPGRWGVEVITDKHRLIFRPLEKLQVQNKGSVAIDFVEIDNTFDLQYKPGFYRQVEAFLSGRYDDFCSISEQQVHMEKVYHKILGINE